MLADLGDVRGQLLEENKYAGKTVWWLYKLRGTDLKTAPLECNNVVLRLSEVYLIAAEAGCKLGGDAAVQGLGYLNEIVKRGNPDNEVTMADYTLDRVLDERSKELVGEGHRFFDLLRNGKTIVRKGGYHLPVWTKRWIGIFTSVCCRYLKTSLSLVLRWNRIRDIPRIDMLLIII